MDTAQILANVRASLMRNDDVITHRFDDLETCAAAGHVLRKALSMLSACPPSKEVDGIADDLARMIIECGIFPDMKRKQT